MPKSPATPSVSDDLAPKIAVRWVPNSDPECPLDGLADLLVDLLLAREHRGKVRHDDSEGQRHAG